MNADELIVKKILCDGKQISILIDSGALPNSSVQDQDQARPVTKPSNRQPFRLSHVERQALQTFVDSPLKKKWIELSESPWVSNMFGVPKKDPATNSFPSRVDWLRSENPNAPIG
ncbi:hypothetical protein Plhal304r1_c083g0167821 [Plasmopara halstedii]